MATRTEAFCQQSDRLEESIEQLRAQLWQSNSDHERTIIAGQIEQAEEELARIRPSQPR